MKIHPTPIWIFASLALLIHVGVLVYFLPRLKPFEIQLSDQIASLSVSLQAIEVGSRNPQPENQHQSRQPARQATHQRETGTQPVSKKTRPTAKSSPKKKAAQTKPTAEPAPPVENLASTPANPDRHEHSEAAMPSPSPALTRARVLTHLRQDLTQYFYYPRLARRNNMQGTVTLGFAISRKGQIHNIRVVRSSGHAILDMAAEDALGKLEKLNWLDNRWQPEFANLELPVIYRLMEN